MKDETKNKIKNGVKYTAISVGVILLFLLGMGVGSCSEKARSRKAVETSAVSPSQYDLLNGASVWTDKVFYAGSGWYSIFNNASYDLYALTLPVGSYTILFEESPSGNDSQLFGIDYQVYQEIEFGRTGNFTDDSGLVNAITSFNSSSLLWFTFDINASNANDYYCFRVAKHCLPVGLYKTTDYWQYVAPSIANLALPIDFNPIWLFGDAYQNAVYGMLSANAEGYSYSALLDVTFRSNGVLYSGVGFYFEPLADTWYQEPATGEIKQADHNANNYHYPVGLYFKRYGSGSGFPDQHPEYYDCVWTPVWGLTNDSQGNSVRYLTPTGAFASEAFRSLDIVAYSSSVPVSGRWPNLNALELLNLKASGYLITGEKTIYDVFDMFGGAFNSFTSVMNIQILPYMTIGMLMFIPLIVIVILAIVRLLNK